MRTILLFALAMVAIYLVRRALQKPGPRQSASKPTDQAERMIECRHCGLHVPESEGVRGDDALFCCAEHLRRHRDGGA